MLLRNRHKIDALLYLINILSLMPLLCFAYPHFSIDTYTIAVMGSDAHINAFVGSFRYVGALLYRVWSALGNDPIENPFLDMLIFIVLVSLAVTLFSLYIYRKLNKKSTLNYIIINFSVLITTTNVWLIDILTFPECIFITSFGIIFCFLSVIIFSYTERKTPIRLVLSSVLLVSASAIYQQFFVVFIIFTVLLNSIELHQSQHIQFKAIFFKYLQLGIFVLASGGVYYVVGMVVQKIFSIQPNERVALNLDTIVENFSYFASHQHSYLKGRGFFNTEILTLCYMSVFLVWFVSFLQHIRYNRLQFIHICILLSYGIAYVSSFMMGLVSTSRSHRAMFGLFAVFALFSIGSIILGNNKFLKTVIIIVLTFVFIMNMYKDVAMSIKQIQVNAREFVITELYIEQIEKHEEEHKETIENIVLCTDGNKDSISTESALSTRYALQGLIEYISGRKFIVRNMSVDEYKKRFQGKSWETLELTEQMIFEEDTLYLCVY